MGRTNRTLGQRKAENAPLVFLFLLLIPVYGGYYTFSVLLSGVCLSVLLLLHVLREKRFSVPVDAAGMCLYGLCLCNLISIPFAVSPGMAFVGFLRSLAGATLYIYAAGCTGSEKDSILNSIAYEGVLLSLLSILAFLITENDPNGRLDGVFQYANTWALYQMICLILLAMKENHRIMDYFLMPVLLVGVFLTGSRSVIVLMAAMAIGGGSVFAVRTRKHLPLLIVAILLLLTGFLASVISGGMVLNRINQITLTSSSLNGRLLYWKDGFAMLREHPLGLGYGGYSYQQAAVQTGIYTVRYVHNDFLQAALDGGAAAGLLLLAVVCFLFLKKENSIRERMVILAIAIHSAVDFDLQFSAVFFLLLFCGSGNGKSFVIRPHRTAVWLGCGLASLCFLYFSIVYYCEYRGQYGQSYHLYPADLELAEAYLMEAASADETEAIVGRIISKTDLSAAAWQSIYASATRRDDIAEMIEAKYHYLILNRYQEAVWREFSDLLEMAAASEENQTLVTAYAKSAEDTLSQTIEGTSYLAWRIADHPDFGFAREIFGRLSALDEGESRSG